MIEKADEQELVMQSSSLLQENYFYLSDIVTSKLLDLKPENANYNYRKGFILLYSQKNWKVALHYLRKAENQTDKNYDMYSAKEESAPIDVLYHIGKCYHLDEQLDNARKYYQKFLEVTNKKSYLAGQAQLQLAQLDNCTAKKKEKNTVVTSLKSPVNSINDETLPICSPDGKAIWFTSRRPWEKGESDFYRDEFHNLLPEDTYVTLDSSMQFTQPLRLTECKDADNEYISYVNVTEKNKYSNVGKTEDGDLSTAVPDSTGKGYLFQALAIKNLNTPFWEKQLTMNHRGDYMIFSSNREGSMGELDLFEMRKKEDGSWSEPKNLGENINSMYDEEAPFLSSDGRFLFFASNGNNSMGEHDIFVSTLKEDNTWSIAEHLGYGINSTADDIGFSLTADGKTGFFSSNRNGSIGRHDIYQCNLDGKYHISGAILEVRIIGFKRQVVPENITLSVTRKKTSLMSPLEKRERDGKYVDQLNGCESYLLELRMDENSPVIHSEEITTICENGFEFIQKDLILDVRNNRIFTPKKYMYTATVTDKGSGSPIVAGDVRYSGNITGGVMLKTTTDDSGLFHISFPDTCYIGDVVQLNIEIEKSGFLVLKEDQRLTLDNREELLGSFKLIRQETGRDLGKDLQLQPIYYDYAKASLRPASLKELDRIVKMMNDNPKLEIELRSHTDCIASDVSNMILSWKRADVAMKYIKQRISNPKRITAKGFGETMPIVPCNCEDASNPCTGEQHQANRRTEFIILNK